MINDDFNKIIAIRFGEMIYFGREALNKLKEHDFNYCQLISRLEFEMMSRFDLGDKWGKYADNAPILFTLKKDIPLDIRIPRPYGIKINV